LALPVSFHHALLKVSVRERGFPRPLQVRLASAWLFRSEAAQPDQKVRAIPSQVYSERSQLKPRYQA